MPTNKISSSFITLITIVLIVICFITCSVKCLEGSSTGKATLKLPKLGVGLLDIETNVERENVLMMALKSGYRMLDIWEGDEIQVEAVISRSKIPRKDLFIVVKLDYPTNNQESLVTADAIIDIMERLKTTYIDLLLINFPYPKDAHLSAWKTMISLKNAGKIRNIGVSNFRFEEIMLLKKRTGVLPSVVQLELNPFNQQSELVKNLTSLGIAIQAYSPLANGQKLNDTHLIGIAKRYDATTAQLMIQWCLQKGFSCITKSTKQTHLEDNINLGEFHIEDIDMKELDALEEGFVTNFNAEAPNSQEDQFSTAGESSRYDSNEVDSKSPRKNKKGRLGDDFEDYYADEAYDVDSSNDGPLGPENGDSKGKLGNIQRSDSQDSYSKKEDNDVGSTGPKGDYNQPRDEF